MASFIELHTSSNSNTKRQYFVSIDGGYYIVEDVVSNKIVLRLRVRNIYPVTYCWVSVDGTVVSGYGHETPTVDDEFLRIQLYNNGDLLVIRDQLCTLPLFYGHDGTSFSLSNDYASTWRGIKKHTINLRAVLETLVPSGMRYETLCSEINILDADQVLHVSRGTLSRHVRNARAWATNRSAQTTDPHLFIRELDSSLERSIHRYQPVLEHAAYEVSGGLDSSVFPLWSSRHHYGEISTLSTVRFPGHFRRTQLQKIEYIQKVSGARLLSLDLETENIKWSPLYMAMKMEDPFYCFKDVYEESNTAHARQLAEHGVGILFIGIGGDELFDNTVHSEIEFAFGQTERQQRMAMPLPPFLTDEFRQAYIDTTPMNQPIATPVLAVNLHSSFIGRNNAFINNDVWPISPFADRRLYHFSQGMPAHFRANKDILRAYYKASGWPESIYNSTTSEHYGIYFDSVFASGFYNNFIEYFLKHGVTVRSGLVDPNKLQRMLAGKTDPYTLNGSKRDYRYYPIYKWLEIEMNLFHFQAKERATEHGTPLRNLAMVAIEPASTTIS